jgi:hypothetical protein
MEGRGRGAGKRMGSSLARMARRRAWSTDGGEEEGTKGGKKEEKKKGK